MAYSKLLGTFQFVDDDDENWDVLDECEFGDCDCYGCNYDD